MKEIDPKTTESDDHTPLLWATENECQEVPTVRMLHTCRGGVTPDSISYIYPDITVLYLTEVHKLKTIKPNIQDYNGRTPLMWATETGHEGTIRMPQEHGNGSDDEN